LLHIRRRRRHPPPLPLLLLLLLLEKHAVKRTLSAIFVFSDT